MPFGGAIKLTGESEYKKALQSITQNLKEISSQMKVTSSMYDKNDKSTSALTARAKDLNNVWTQQKAKLDTLKNNYESITKKYQANVTAHEKLLKSYENEKSKLETIGKTLGTTSKEYQQQKTKVEEMAKVVSNSSKNLEQNEKAMSQARIEINKAQADYNKTSKAIDNLGKEAEETGKQAKQSSEGFTVLKGALADLASKAVSTAINGMKRLGSTVLDVGKQAVASYADYEQLVGGVETLFKGSSKIVQDYANNAYKSAGLSANEYMETVTSFSASLLQGLGGDTAKAAKIADMAIIDMSDNANKMGTDMQMIQNAYQGFAKDNFTMLDNLKLRIWTELQEKWQD